MNNAGVATPGPLEHVTREELEAQFRVNLFGAVLTTKAFLPLIERAKGRIVNVGAANARLAMPLMGVLSATKFALEAITDALRVELRRTGIRVSLVEPGMTYAEADKQAFGDHLLGELDAAPRAPARGRPPLLRARDGAPPRPHAFGPFARSAARDGGPTRTPRTRRAKTPRALLVWPRREDRRSRGPVRFPRPSRRRVAAGDRALRVTLPYAPLAKARSAWRAPPTIGSPCARRSVSNSSRAQSPA